MKQVIILIILIFISIPFYASKLNDKLIIAAKNNNIGVVKKLIEKALMLMQKEIML